MAKRFFKIGSQVFIAVTILFFVLESIFFLAGFPQGASRFVEQIILKEKLSLKKPQGKFRIFTFGESTMHGAQYGPASNPARWLQVYLNDFLPHKNVRVVNFGRLGQGGDFISMAFRETAAYQSDLAIFYMGHNGFLPGNHKRDIETEHKSFRYHFAELVKRSRFLSAVYRWVLKIKMDFKSERRTDFMGVQVTETWPGKILGNLAPRNEPFYLENLAFMQNHYLAITEFAKRKNIRVMFMKPVSNLKDFAPNYSDHLQKLSDKELTQWQSFYYQGRQTQKSGDLAKALLLYKQAYAIDNTYADLSFRMGRIYFEQGDFKKANELFEDARDNDVFIVRATRDVLEIFSDLEKNKDVPVVDTEKVLLPELPGGIMGEPLIEDNVHFSVKGHSLTGRLLAEEIANRNWIAPRDEWHFERERPFEEIAKELGVNTQLQLNAYLDMVNYFGSHVDNRLHFAQKAYELDPKNILVLRALAWSYWIVGEKEKAVEVYQELAHINPAALEEVMQRIPNIRQALGKSSAEPRDTQSSSLNPDSLVPLIANAP